MTTDETLIKICERYTLIGVKKLLLRNERDGYDREIVRCFCLGCFGAFDGARVAAKKNASSGKWYMQYIFDNIGGYSIRINAAGGGDRMKYTLIWIDSGAVLDSSIVCESIQEAIEAKKRFQKTVRRNTAPAACVTAWAIEWDVTPERNGVNGLIYGGYRHFVTAGLSRSEAFRRQIQLDAARATSVKMYEYVQRIID